jgi:hypothetical protein
MSELYAKPSTLRAATLADMADLLKQQRTRALDVVAPASAISSRGGLLVVSGTEVALDENGATPTAGEYRLTRTAESGLADKLNIPLPYLRRMRETGRFDLYDINVDGWLHGWMGDPPVLAEDGPVAEPDPRKFLVRILRGDADGEGYVRAVLSDTYKVIDSLDVLLATLDGIREAGVTVDVRECDLSESKMYVKLWSPQVAAVAPKLLENYRSPFEGGVMRFGGDGRGWDLERAREAAAREGLAFEPGKEPIVFAGFVLSNSDIGLGRFSIAPQIVIQACGNGLTITGDAIAKTHLGGRLDEGRIRWSDDTEAANLALIRKQTRDAVRDFLSPQYVQAKVEELVEDAGTPVESAKDAVQIVAKKLQFTEAESDSILEHFLLGGQRTAGGLMQAVSSVAQTVEDGDRAAELEAQAIPAMKLAARAPALVGAGSR